MRKMTLVALICLLSVSYLSAQENSKSTYYLIRHAERAVKWSEILNKFGINEVYSTDYKRTLNTVKPTAKANKITVKTYHPFKLDYEQFLVDTKGKNVLIAGHSNTTASFANKLIGKEVYPEMSDDNNANLYIVTIDGDTISHVMIVMQ